MPCLYYRNYRLKHAKKINNFHLTKAAFSSITTFIFLIVCSKTKSINWVWNLQTKAGALCLNAPCAGIMNLSIKMKNQKCCLHLRVIVKRVHAERPKNYLIYLSFVGFNKHSRDIARLKKNPIFNFPPFVLIMQLDHEISTSIKIFSFVRFHKTKKASVDSLSISEA